LIAAIKNQATGHYILNGKGEEVASRSFIDLGVEWNYIVEDEVETLHTDGPLHDPVVVLVMTLPPYWQRRVSCLIRAPGFFANDKRKHWTL